MQIEDMTEEQKLQYGIIKIPYSEVIRAGFHRRFGKEYYAKKPSGCYEILKPIGGFGK